MTVVGYGLSRLESSGVTDVFAVPGDRSGRLGLFPILTVCRSGPRAGPVSLGSALNRSGFTDYNALGTGQYTGVSLSGATVTSQALFQIMDLDVTNRGADGHGYYPIDGTRTLASKEIRISSTFFSSRR